MERDEQNLIAQCLGGNQRAWAVLVDRYAGLVRAWTRRSGLPDDLCDDVTQVVFATLVRRLATLRSEASLPSWLATTTRRACWRAMRRARRQRQHEAALVEEATIEDSELARLERGLRLRWALDQLSPRCRELLTAMYLTDPQLGYEQTAEKLSIARGSVGPLRQRCIARLARIMRNAVDSGEFDP